MNFQQPLLQSSVSHDYSEIILICWSCAQKTLSMSKTILLQTIKLYIYFFKYYYWPQHYNNCSRFSTKNSICGLMFIKINFHLSLVFFKKAKMWFLCSPYNRMKGANLLNSIIATRCKKHAWNMTLVLQKLSINLFSMKLHSILQIYCHDITTTP